MSVLELATFTLPKLHPVYPSTPPPPPQKKKIENRRGCFHFSWILQSSQEKAKTCLCTISGNKQGVSWAINEEVANGLLVVPESPRID